MTIPNNPAPGREWTNDETGVTYKWDGDRWIVLSNSDEILQNYLPLTGGNLTGQLTIDKVREDTNTIGFSINGRIKDNSNDVFNGVLFKSYQRHEGNVQPDYIAYYGSSGGANEILNRTTAQDEFADKQIVTDALQTQNVIEGQVNALETQIQLLAGVKAVGKWNYVRNISGGSPRPPATGTFYATHKDGADVLLMNWADARLIMINKTDLDSKEFTFSDFEEGDKVEILAEDGSSACYGTITNNPNQEAYGNMVITVERSQGGPPQNSLKAFLISAYRPGSSNGLVDLDILDNRYLVKTGDTMEAPLNFQRGTKDTPQFKISPNGSEDFATNIYSLNGGDMRLRTSHTNNEGDHVGSHIVLNSNGGSPETKIYHVVEAGDSGAVPKSYVDGKVSAGASVPVGAIMIWMNSAVPDGWFKLQGGNFDTSIYPKLHTYLLATDGYTAGKLPDWKGHYPGEYGDHLAGVSLGKKLGQQTAQPSGGAPKSGANIPTGAQRTFTATGNTNAYSNGIGPVTIDSGWDNNTRPKTVVVHYIIKHD